MSSIIKELAGVGLGVKFLNSSIAPPAEVRHSSSCLDLRRKLTKQSRKVLWGEDFDSMAQGIPNRVKIPDS